MTSHTPVPVHAAPGGTMAREGWLPALACALAGAAVFQFYGNANHGYIDTSSLFWWWGYQWFQWGNPNAENQHAPLIFGLSVWLIVRNLRASGGRQGTSGERPAGPDAEIRNRRWAVAALAGGLLLHAVGFAVQQARISIVALLLFGWGVLALGGGRRWRQAAAFPLAFMVFAIPLNVLDSVGFWLRMGVINASAGLAHAAGIGVLQNGTQLVAPDGRYQYDVAAACSGVRSLMALAALSLLTGYLTFRPWWLRALVLTLCVPLTYLGNLARIAAIIFAAHWGGQRWGENAHDVMGYGVFVIVLGGMLLVVGAVRKIAPGAWLVEESNGGAGTPGYDRDVVCSGTNGGARLGSAVPWGIAVAIGLFASGEMLLLAHIGRQSVGGSAGVVLEKNGRDPVELPSFLGTDWIGRVVEVSAVEREILPPDTGFSRKSYVALADPGRPVFLSIVLSGRDRTSIHRPELCLVGQGWTIDDTSGHRFAYPAPGGGSGFPATVLHVRHEMMTARGRAAVPQLVAYWFVSSDAVVATHWERFLHDAWSRLRHLRADRWAYVLMQTDATDGEAAAFARMQAVLDRTLPAFQLPQAGR